MHQSALLNSLIMIDEHLSRLFNSLIAENKLDS